MRKSIVTRIKITKTGKFVRRKMGLAHFHAKKSNKQLNRKRKPVSVKPADLKTFKNYF